MDWLKQKEEFEIKDVRSMKGNFLPSLLKKAQKMEAGKGLCVIQSFEPIPLYSALAELSYEHHTEKISETEYPGLLLSPDGKRANTCRGHECSPQTHGDCKFLPY